MKKQDSFNPERDNSNDLYAAEVFDDSFSRHSEQYKSDSQELNKKSTIFANKRNKAIYLIALTAMFTALNTVANAFLSFPITPTVKYSATLTFSFFTGIALGPIYGFIAGFLGDFFGWLLFVDGVYNPIINLVSGLFCLIPGLIFYISKKYFTTKKNKHSALIGMFVSFLLCYIFGSVLLNSLGIWLYYPNLHVKHGTFFVYIGTRAISQLPNAIINFALTLVLYFILKKVKYFKDFI